MLTKGFSFWGLHPQTPTMALPLDPAGGLQSPDSLLFPPIMETDRRLWFTLLDNPMRQILPTTLVAV